MPTDERDGISPGENVRRKGVGPGVLSTIVLAVALSATLWMWQRLGAATEQQLNAEFRVQVRESIARIKQRMATYEQVLHGARGFFDSFPNADRDAFRKFVAALELERRYPGIQGVGFAKAIFAAQRGEHVAAMRGEGFADYEINPSGERELYAPIIYLEPFTGLNLRGLGFDPYSEPVRQSAMARARDSNDARLSGKVRLVLESDHDVQPGFVMYLSVYDKFVSRDAAVTDREAIRGWVFAPFRMDDLMRGVEGERQAELHLTIYDGETIADTARLFDDRPSNTQDSQLIPKLVTTEHIELAGRQWTLVFESLPRFDARYESGKATTILIAGVAMSLMLALLTWLLATGRLRALLLAKKMTRELSESEQRWRFALEGAGDGVWDWNTGDSTFFASPKWKQIYGLDAEDKRELITLDEWKTYIFVEDRQRATAKLEAFVNSPADFYVDERRVCGPDGIVKWLLVRGMVVARTAMGTPLRMIGTESDISERKGAEARQQLAMQVFETMGEAVMVTAVDGKIIAINSAFSRITGYSENEVLGRTPKVLSSKRHDKAFYEAMWTALNAQGEWAGEVWNQRKNGEVFPEWQTISCVRDGAGQVTHYVSVFADLSEIRRAQEEAERRSWRDSLTGLPNRALFLQRLEQAIANAYREGRFADVLLLDLDRFKDINEARGIAVGDTLLKAVAMRLAEHLRTDDMLARLDSDEFAILVPRFERTRDEAGRAALAVAEKLRAVIGEGFELNSEVFHLDASIGVVLFPDSQQDTAADILRQADTAMHLAKAQGGARTVFFEAAMGESIRERYSLERELRLAIAEGQLRIFLQLQVDENGLQVGAEALVRWQHPERGLIPPGLFIPLAESSSLIIDIDRWMLGEVCQMLARLEQEKEILRISVNISPRNFQAIDFVDEVKRCLATSGADPSHLVLEVTEGLVIGNIAEVVEKMTDLTSIGVHFSMDDFGTGYSSLSYLKRLPIHELKIDRSFIQDAPTDPNDAALVDTILAVAHHLNLQVVAEGVETEAQAAFLRARGRIIHQGYLYGRPVPAEDWLVALRNQRKRAAVA